MLKDIRVTLYDVFGFLLPGMVFLTSVLVLVWAVYLPRIPLAAVDLPAVAWTGLLVAAYFAGHVAQAISIQLVRWASTPEQRLLGRCKSGRCVVGSLPAPIRDAAKQRAAEILGADLDRVDAKWFYRICDQVVAQRGRVADRDVYIYREGFYRGTAASFLMLALATLVRAVVPGASVQVSGAPLTIGRWTLPLLSAVFLGAALASYGRYRRFGEYKVSQAVIGCAVLSANEKPSDQEQESQDD